MSTPQRLPLTTQEGHYAEVDDLLALGYPLQDALQRAGVNRSGWDKYAARRRHNPAKTRRTA